jgi:hypothetical protein
MGSEDYIKLTWERRRMNEKVEMVDEVLALVFELTNPEILHENELFLPGFSDHTLEMVVKVNARTAGPAEHLNEVIL